MEADSLSESRLEKVKEHYSKDTGEVFMTGVIGNFRIKYCGNMLSLVGSLPKFYYGNNLEILHRKEIESAIRLLSAGVAVNLLRGKVYRLDLGLLLMFQMELEMMHEIHWGLVNNFLDILHIFYIKFLLLLPYYP